MTRWLMVAVVTSMGCGQPQQTTCQLATAGGYPATGFMAATTAERGINERLDELISSMEGAAKQPPVLTTRATLDMQFGSGSPSLSSLTAPSFAAQVNEVFTAFIASQDKQWTPANPPNGGGRYGAFLFSERGLDLAEFTEKGLFGALVFAEVVKRLPAATTPDSIDQLVALYGATPAFPQNDSNAEGKDTFTAKYAKRRTPPGMSGSYTIIRDAFITARLASTSANCSAERAQALETVRQEWERVLSATAVYYIHSATTKLQDASADATKKASALHDLGEAIGLVHGLKAVPAASRKITDPQLDALLASLKAPTFSTASTFRLVTDTPADLDSLLMANTQLGTVYGFSADDMARFRTSY